MRRNLMMKKKYTNKSFYKTIVELLKEKNLLPDILWYWDEAIGSEVEILDYEWDITGDIRFGNCEGIYLDVYATGNIGYGRDMSKVLLGTFKTLGETKEYLYAMAKLEADFIWETNQFVNEHIDDFEWTGYSIEFYSEEKRLCAYSVKTEVNNTKISELVKMGCFPEWERVVITELSTCKETIKFRKELDL